MSKVGTTLGFAGAAVAASLLGPHSPAFSAESVLSAIAACKAIIDDRQRLQCLDEAVARLDEPRAPIEREQVLAQREMELKRREAVLEAKSEAAEKSGSLFGIRLSSATVDAFTTAAAGLPRQNVERGSDGAVDAITASVRKWSYDSRGQITVVLDNGQVWQQTDTSEVFLSPDSKKQHRVRISRALMGSFTMTVNNKNKGHKVRRLEPAAG